MSGATSLNDTQITLIAGGISLIAATILVVYYLRAKRIIDEMWAVHTYQAAELRKMCSGGFNAVVEVEGKVSCDDPLTAPASQFPCVWCRTKVEREMTRTVTSRSGTRTEHVWELGYDHTIATVFKVTDDTGYTLVDPTGADIQTETPYVLIADKIEPWFAEVGYSDTGRYRITEQIFVPTGHVYVLGQATSVGEGTSPDALIHKPDEGYIDPRHRYFIISRESEQEIARSKEISLTVCFWASVLGFLFAAYCGLHVLGIAP